MVLGKTELTQDTYLIGLGVSPGVGIGRICLLNRPSMVVEWQLLEPEIPAELERFRAALKTAAEQLRSVRERVSARGHLREHLYILDSHLLILEDPLLIEKTEQLIAERYNAESAFEQTLCKMRVMFADIEDDYLRERSSDLDAVGQRVQRALAGVSENPMDKVRDQSLIVSHDLSPADTMQLDRERIVGFVTDKGGRTSHAAILARSMGIPAVVGLETVTAVAENDVAAVVDGSTGVVILNPSEKTFQEYLKRKLAFEYFEKELLAYCQLSAETRDHVKIALRANLELVSEVPAAQKDGAEGIGLYRTEFLYLNRNTPPAEEEQYQAYAAIASSLAPQPLTIRTLDAGGDKFVPDLNLAREDNPAMGLRAVRLSLRDPGLFKVQLRAILRASVVENVRLMFPMVSGVGELRACLKCLEEAKQGLSDEGIAFDGNMPVGIMIETPAAVMVASQLAREVDFFSIGTNDLVQYCLAVDRGNEHVSYLYDPLHPAILRSIQQVCQAADAAGIPTSLCGEMAAEPLYLPVLIGLGLRELSMNHACVPRVKRVLRTVRIEQCEQLVQELLNFPTVAEISAHLEEQMHKWIPELLGDFTL